MVSDSVVLRGRENFKDELIMAEAIGCGNIDIFQKAIRNLTAASDNKRLKEVYDDFNEKVKQKEESSCSTSSTCRNSLVSGIENEESYLIKKERKVDLQTLLKHFEPIEWEMNDFHDLILETLEMDNAHLTSVPESIQEIEYYAFREVQAVSFNHNPNLRDASVLGKLENLQAINMWGCNLQEIPESWARLSKISFLGLANNPNLKIFSAITSMTSLQFLDLGCCGLKRLPQEIVQISSHLVVLALGGNVDIEIDDVTISKLRKLRRLSLNDCGLVEVPKGVYELCQLRHLHVDNNHITSLTQHVLKLHQLVGLSVTGNPEIKLPKVMGQMEMLQQVVVDDIYDVRSISFQMRNKVRRRSHVRSVFIPKQ